MQCHFHRTQLGYSETNIKRLTISVLQACYAVTTEYGIPSKFVRKSTLSLQIKISTAQLNFSNRNVIICVYCRQNQPKVGIPILRYKRSKSILLHVYLCQISARYYQIDVALSNGVGFQPIRIAVL